MELACSIGSCRAIMEWLLKHTKLKNVTLPSGVGLMHGPCLENSTANAQTLEVLLDHGADFLLQDGKGSTAAHHACSGGHLEVLECFDTPA
jgi:ankyrin repeat protein